MKKILTIIALTLIPVSAHANSPAMESCLAIVPELTKLTNEYTLDNSQWPRFREALGIAAQAVSAQIQSENQNRPEIAPHCYLIKSALVKYILHGQTN